MPKNIVTSPINISIPKLGLVFAESIHAPSFKMHIRKDSYAKLFYIYQGAVELEAIGDGVSDKLEAGMVAPVDPHQSHRLHDLRPSTVLLLCLDDRFFDSNPGTLELWQRLVELYRAGVRPGPAVSILIERSIRRALSEQHADRFGREPALRAEATQLLIELSRLPQLSRQDADGRVAAVIAQIDSSYFETWTLARGSRRAGLSERQFTKIFNARTGMTFLQYLTARRIDAASALLRQPNQTIAGVAFSCGFNDLSHFYRVFRKETGTTPKAWAGRSKPKKA